MENDGKLIEFGFSVREDKEDGCEVVASNLWPILTHYLTDLLEKDDPELVVIKLCKERKGDGFVYWRGVYSTQENAHVSTVDSDKCSGK